MVFGMVLYLFLLFRSRGAGEGSKMVLFNNRTPSTNIDMLVVFSAQKSSGDINMSNAQVNESNPIAVFLYRSLTNHSPWLKTGRYLLLGCGCTKIQREFHLFHRYRQIVPIQTMSIYNSSSLSMSKSQRLMSILSIWMIFIHFMTSETGHIHHR